MSSLRKSNIREFSNLTSQVLWYQSGVRVSVLSQVLWYWVRC